MKGEVRPMQVILKADVNKIGRAGELLTVSDGYARNFLLPRGLAEEATAGKIADLKERQKHQKAKEEKLRQEAEVKRQELQGRVVRIEATAGENGKLFGSITAAQIAEALEAQYSVKVDKRDVKTSETVKQPGNHPFTLKLHSGVAADMVLSVTVRGA